MPKILITLPEYLALVREDSGVYSDGPKTGPGTSTELAIAATVALAVAEHFGVSPQDLSVAGPGPYALPKGAVTVTWYGGDGFGGWIQWWVTTDAAKELAEQEDYRFVALTSNTLAVYFS